LGVPKGKESCDWHIRHRLLINSERQRHRRRRQKVETKQEVQES